MWSPLGAFRTSGGGGKMIGSIMNVGFGGHVHTGSDSGDTDPGTCSMQA